MVLIKYGIMWQESHSLRSNDCPFLAIPATAFQYCIEAWQNSTHININKCSCGWSQSLQERVLTQGKKSSPLNKHKTKNVETQHKSTQQNLPDPLKLTKTWQKVLLIVCIIYMFWDCAAHMFNKTVESQSYNNLQWGARTNY